MRKTSRAVLIGLIFYSTCWGQLIGYKTRLWKSLPIKSETEYNAGAVGGEGWQFCHGGDRSVSNPNVIYMASDGGSGVWRSQDGGERWVLTKMRGLVHRNLYSIAIDPVNPKIVYVVGGLLWDVAISTANDGLYKSYDSGRNWTLIKQANESMNWGWPNGTRVYQHLICYDPTSIGSERAETWYWAVAKGASAYSDDYDERIYRSTDGGETWSSYVLTTNHAYPCQMYCLADGTVLYGSEDGLFKIINDTLTQVTAATLPAGKITGMQVHPSNANIFWVVVNLQGVFKTEDGGSTFTEILDTAYANTIGVAPSNPLYMMVTYNGAGSGRPSYSQDGGETWASTTMAASTQVQGSNNWSSSCSSILFSATDETNIVGYGDYRIYHSTDGGVNGDVWSTGYTGMCSNECSFSWYSSGTTNIASGLWDCGTIRSANGGLWFVAENDCTDAETLGLWGAAVSSSPLEVEFLGFVNTSNLDRYSWIRGSNSHKYLPVYWDGVWHKAVMNGQPTSSDDDLYWSGCAVDTGYVYSSYHVSSDYGHTYDLVKIVTVTCNDCEDTWTASTNVTAEDDEVDYVEGTMSQKFTVGEDFTTGVIAYYENNPSNSSYNDTHIVFKIKSSIEISQGQLEFVYDGDTGCVSPVENQDLPAIPANTWTEVHIRIHKPGPGNDNIGIYAAEDVGACVIHVDDFYWTQGMMIGFAPSDEKYVYATNSNTSTIYRSEDHGGTWALWESVPNATMKCNAVTPFAVDPFNPDVIYTQYGGTLSANQGNFRCYNKTEWNGRSADTWTDSSPSLRAIAGATYPISETAYFYMKNIACDPRVPGLIYVGMACAGSSVVFRSEDYGVTWEDITLNLPSSHSATIVVSPVTGEVAAVGLNGTYILPPPYNGPTPLYNLGLAIGD